MKFVGIAYELPFQRHLDSVKQFSKDNREGMPALTRDPPYNFRRIAELSNSELDRLAVQDMSQLKDFLTALMSLCKLGYMFCPTLQFKTWYELLAR